MTAQRWVTVVGLAWTILGCGELAHREPGSDEGPEPQWETPQGREDRVQAIEGFSGPESVRYDKDQDVWFVGNFNGDSDERDANGFVSRVSAETGEIQVLRFAVGTTAHPLHAARGMFVTGDTLWVADIDGVHGFHRYTGAQVAYVDLSSFAPGFLNDLVQGPDTALYITDTGRSAVYRIFGRQASEVVADTSLGGPNGITWDPRLGTLVLVPWQPSHGVHTWRLGEASRTFGPPETRGRLDGVEAIDGRLVVASQADSALYLMDEAGFRLLVTVWGAPADIGVDTRRSRVAVPYVGLDRVDVWQLPSR